MLYDNDGTPLFDGEEEARAALENFDLSREDRAAAEQALAAMALYPTAQDLVAEDVISQGQADDCHYESVDGVRLWVSRTGLADGEPFENTITVEAQKDGSWVNVAKYDGGELREDDDTLDGIFTLRASLGNAEFCEHAHVVEALRQVANELEGAMPDKGIIYDVNGNTVGRWGFSSSSEVSE